MFFTTTVVFLKGTIQSCRNGPGLGQNKRRPGKCISFVKSGLSKKYRPAENKGVGM